MTDLPARIEAAYNDSRGVTAEFNRNMLRVLNHELGTGGTIAGAQASATDYGYKSGAYDVNSLINAVPNLGKLAVITVPRDATPEALEEARAEELVLRRAQPFRPATPTETIGIYVAHVQTLRRLALARPAMAARKVFIIGDAEFLVPQEASPEAANALLKVLEEPPADTTITNPPDTLPGRPDHFRPDAGTVLTVVGNGDNLRQTDGVRVELRRNAGPAAWWDEATTS